MNTDPISLSGEQLNELVARLIEQGGIYETEPVEIW